MAIEANGTVRPLYSAAPPAGAAVHVLAFAARVAADFVALIGNVRGLYIFAQVMDHKARRTFPHLPPRG